MANNEKNLPGIGYSGFTVDNIVHKWMQDNQSEEIAEKPESPEPAVEDLLEDEESPEVAKSDKDDILDLDDTISGASDEYRPSFDDDEDKENIVEESYESDDFVLSEDDDAAVIKQPEGTVSWYIDGMYNENGKTHHFIYLKENPPILVVEASTGEEANFILTKELTRTMSKTFGDLNKAYYGTRKERGEKSFDDKVKNIPDWARANPIQAAFTALLIFAFFVLLIVTAL